MFTEFCIACSHVLEQSRPVLYVVRDGDDWTFACGQGDHPGIADWGRAHTHHFLDADPTLQTLTRLRPHDQTARPSVHSPWLFLPNYAAR